MKIFDILGKRRLGSYIEVILALMIISSAIIFSLPVKDIVSFDPVVDLHELTLQYQVALILQGIMVVPAVLIIINFFKKLNWWLSLRSVFNFINFVGFLFLSILFWYIEGPGDMVWTMLMGLSIISGLLYLNVKVLPQYAGMD